VTCDFILSLQMPHFFLKLTAVMFKVLEHVDKERRERSKDRFRGRDSIMTIRPISVSVTKTDNRD